MTDFVIGLRAAGALRQPTEALPALLSLAEGKGTEFQKSIALEQAAAAAMALKDFAQAEALCRSIPNFAVRKTAQMQTLIAQSKAPQVIEQFGGEDLTKWPFWKRGDGYLHRGRAHLINKNFDQARSDLTNAIEWLSDERSRRSAEQSLQSLQSVK